MKLQTIALTLQKRRINGPFKRVTFIDPYPGKRLRAPSFLATNLLAILAFGTPSAASLLINAQSSMVITLQSSKSAHFSSAVTAQFSSAVDRSA